MNYQERYLMALYADFQAKVRVIADLVKDHPGEYGRVIENAVRDLLRVLLPTSCELGSGFVIDSDGGRSQQCDIIVYDSATSFSVFGHAGQILYPVESVHAVVQVTKTLTAGKVRSACENIASVRRLDNKGESALELHKGPGGSVECREYYATPPVGIIIGYQSGNTRDLGTIRRWFDRAFAAGDDPRLHPDLAVSILEAFKLRYEAQSHRRDPPEVKFYPYRDCDEAGRLLRGPQGELLAVAVPMSAVRNRGFGAIEDECGHKIVKLPKCPNVWHVADDARLLMTTLGTIANLISVKRRMGVTPIDRYFSPYFPEAVSI